MPTPTTKTELIKAQAAELIKSYSTIDSQGRVEYVYTAQTDCADGSACTRVQYTYQSATSTVVKKMKETYSTWVAATMDI